MLCNFALTFKGVGVKASVYLQIFKLFTGECEGTSKRSIRGPGDAVVLRDKRR